MSDFPGDFIRSYLAIIVVVAVLAIGGHVAIAYFVYRYLKKHGLPAININSNTSAPGVAAETELYTVVPDSQIREATVERFLREIAGEKPIRFMPAQLSGFTNNYSAQLGTGGFGVVYKGMLPKGLLVAVKVLHGGLDRRSEQQFMAEVGTIGRTHHINLVRLFGFCFDTSVLALVYEYMDKGALDTYLFNRNNTVTLLTLRAIAVGIARGLRYLHEECQKKIIHYDIKPGNVLLDGDLTPKVADFGLAQLVNRADTHVSVPGVLGTPGYAAPEMWEQSGITEKCDVYSFGMLLFELVGRRKILDKAAPESREWFPEFAWVKYESGNRMELVTASRGDVHGEAAASDEQQCKELVERMCKVAFWCIQKQPEMRPSMGMVVKMLEGEKDVMPPTNPFEHLMAGSAVANLSMSR